MPNIKLGILNSIKIQLGERKIDFSFAFLKKFKKIANKKRK